MAQQGRQRRTARAALLMLAVLGLLGMHGLPDAMATSVGSAPMSASASMSSPLAAAMDTTGGGPVRPARHADPAAHHHVRHTDGDLQPTDASLAAATGCGMDHANCVAVLRDPGQQVGAALTVVAALEMPCPALVSPLATGSRAPPDVSLIGLGISRT